MKNILLLSALLLGLFCHCSVPVEREEEEPSGLGEDPIAAFLWMGDTDKFVVTPQAGIRLDASAEYGGSAYLSTPSTALRDTRWELDVELGFDPSDRNYALFYPASSSSVLSDALEGYCLMIGGRQDNVAFYRQSGDTLRMLGKGRELMRGLSAPSLSLRLECDAQGYWTLWTQLADEEAYVREFSVREESVEHSAYCGVCCVYTKTRSKGFTFRHLRISSGVDPFLPGEEATGNDEKLPVEPLEIEEDVRGRLLFNEVMYDPSDDGAEYVEVYNPTAQTLSLSALYLYKMHEDGTVYSTTTLVDPASSLPLDIPPGAYLCFTRYASLLMQKHGVSTEYLLELPKFPVLSNNGGFLALSCSKKPERGRTLDTCRFGDALREGGERRRGVSLEKQSPELSSLNKHWRSSRHATGGTPGLPNE